MLPLSKIYRSIYPWSSLNQFSDQLIETIAYKSPDNSLIAINKPFGVGTYAVHDNNVKKTNQDKLLSHVFGQPRYSIADALESIGQALESPKPYAILKGIDRYMSGLVLVTNDLERHKKNLARALRDSKKEVIPSYGFRAITSGYPTVKSNSIKERVGCEIVEIDELGDHKEPTIIMNPGSSFKNQKHKHKRLYQVELVIKKIDRQSSTSLLEVYVSNTRWDFVRCYVSSKTAFILGDVRFSKRIRNVLGKNVQVSAHRTLHNDDYEPLNEELQRILNVSKNASIPLMLDMHELRLKNYYQKEEIRDLHIISQHMPLHFAETAKRLRLLEGTSLT